MDHVKASNLGCNTQQWRAGWGGRHVTVDSCQGGVKAALGR